MNKNKTKSQIQRRNWWLSDEKGFVAWVKKVKGSRSANRQLQNSHGDVKYSRGNVANNIVMTMDDAG